MKNLGLSIWGDLTTCFASLGLITVLLYNNLFLSIGKTSFLPFIVGISLFEILKFSLTLNKQVQLIKKSYNVICIAVCSFVVIYAFTVLLGGPFLHKFEENVMFSFLLVILSVLPIALNNDLMTSKSMLSSIVTFEGDQLQQVELLKSKIILFGAWLGAFIIPLDWNRPWQIWPIPNSVGALIGYSVAHCITSIYKFKILQKKSFKHNKYLL